MGLVEKLVNKLRRKKPEVFVEPTPWELAEVTIFEIADRVAARHRAQANDINVESATLRAKLMAKATAIDEFVHELRAELQHALHDGTGGN